MVSAAAEDPGVIVEDPANSQSHGVRTGRFDQVAAVAHNATTHMSAHILNVHNDTPHHIQIHKVTHAPSECLAAFFLYVEMIFCIFSGVANLTGQRNRRRGRSGPRTI